MRAAETNDLRENPMLRRGLNGYPWSPDDQAAFSSWSKCVLLCYGCVVAAIVIVVLAIAFL